MNKNNEVVMSHAIFKSRVARQPNNESDCTRRLIKIFELQYDDNHKVVIKEVGEHDIYAKIQTYKNDNDLDRIIKTIEITQNPQLYVSKEGYDLLNMPTSVVEAQQLISEANEKIKKDDFFKAKNKEYEKKYGTGLSMSEYVKIFDRDELINYYQNKIDNLKQKEKEKGGEK